MQLFSNPVTVARSLDETNAFWSSLVKQAPKVRTDAGEIDALFNTWNPVQVYVTSHLGRHPSFYSGGSWVCGMRDQAQDAFGVLPVDPQYTRSELLRVAANIWEDGRFVHLVSRTRLTPTESSKADSGLWLIMTADDYIRETGDVDVLFEPVGFLDSEVSSSLYDHLRRMLDRSLGLRGTHGLPLIRKGDWNDALDGVGAEGRGESVWMAEFLVWLLLKFGRLAALTGDTRWCRRANDEAVALKALINETAWDGDWYIRGFTDSGAVFGAASCRQGRIFLNAQSWAVLSGIANEERTQQCLDACLQYLQTEYGPRTLFPAYSDFDPNIGVLSAFMPGFKENGAIFSHSAAFFIAALARAGRSDDALRVLRSVLPTLRGQDPLIYRLEPYVYGNFVSAPDTQVPGRGHFHWLTGTAAWMYRVVLDELFGLQAGDDNRLHVRPSLPAAWIGAKAERLFRGCRYRFVYHAADGGGSGLSVDGVRLMDDGLPWNIKQKECDVDVYV